MLAFAWQETLRITTKASSLARQYKLLAYVRCNSLLSEKLSMRSLREPGASSTLVPMQSLKLSWKQDTKLNMHDHEEDSTASLEKLAY